MTTPDDEARQLAEIREHVERKGYGAFDDRLVFLLAIVDKLQDRNEALEVKCDLFSASLKKADRENDELRARLAKCREAALEEAAKAAEADAHRWHRESRSGDVADSMVLAIRALAATQDEEAKP